MQGLSQALVVTLAVALVSCTAAPPVAEPILRHRAASSIRAYESLWEAVQSARATVESGLADLDDTSRKGFSPDEAYRLARRVLLRADSRIEHARKAALNADAHALEILDAWFAEQWGYSDERLRADTRARLKRGHGARDTIRTAVHRTFKALEDARQEVSDRTLFLKHCRDEGRLRPLPVSEEGTRRYAKARADLAEAAALLRAGIDDWRTMLGQPREELP
jgi:hypothetical protein